MQRKKVMTELGQSSAKLKAHLKVTSPSKRKCIGRRKNQRVAQFGIKKEVGIVNKQTKEKLEILRSRRVRSLRLLRHELKSDEELRSSDSGFFEEVGLNALENLKLDMTRALEERMNQKTLEHQKQLKQLQQKELELQKQLKQFQKQLKQLKQRTDVLELFSEQAMTNGLRAFSDLVLRRFLMAAGKWALPPKERNVWLNSKEAKLIVKEKLKVNIMDSEVLFGQRGLKLVRNIKAISSCITGTTSHTSKPLEVAVAIEKLDDKTFGGRSCKEDVLWIFERIFGIKAEQMVACWRRGKLKEEWMRDFSASILRH